jgi:threonine dehydratase
MSNTKATGVAYLDPEFSTCYATEEIGYATSAQGAVTQATSKSTGVTLNKSAGQITLNNAALAAGATAIFTLTNNVLTAKDVLIVNVGSGGTSGAYWPYVANVGAGTAVIGVYNNTAGSLSEAIVINFAIIHNAS